MRVIGGIVLLAGIWPLWRTLTGHDVLDAGGIVMVFTGLALLSGRHWARAIGLGEGAFAGLCVTNGIALAIWGALMLFAYWEFVSAHLKLPVRSITSPLVFLGGGVLLILAGVRRVREILREPVA